MNDGPPEILAIEHDDHLASHVGRTADGRQFFLTTPGIPAAGTDPGRGFLAVYLFDDDGRLIDAIIDDLGARTAIDPEETTRLTERRMSELGPVEFGRIEVRPFRVERFGIIFGLVPSPPTDETDEDDHWWVTVEPGDYMAFHPPWDGDYDT